MSDGSVSSVEVGPVLPPPNLYNLAVLEAFRAGAEQSKALKDHPDLVIILAGSFSKGFGHLGSDSDWVLLKKDIPLPNREASDLVYDLRVDSEFNRLVATDPRYQPLKEYRSLNKTIDDRLEALVDAGKVERYSQEYLKRYQARPSLLQRAFKSKLVKPIVPEGWKNFVGSAFYNDFDQDLINDGMVHMIRVIQGFNKDRVYPQDSFHQTLALLAAELGVNAHEVTPGTLINYQNTIVRVTRALAEDFPENYQKFISVMKDEYRSYTRQPGSRHGKSDKYTETLFRTEQGEPLLEFYRRFPEFPDIDQLEEYFKKP